MTKASISEVPPERAERRRLVAGVFPSLLGASEAIETLVSIELRHCDLLLAREDASVEPIPGYAMPELRAAASVFVHRIDRSAPDRPALGAALGGSDGAHGLLQRILDHVSHGAAVVVVHATNSTQQLAASRALLDAKCKELLTHEVVQSAACAPHKDEGDDSCCGSCASKACGRFDPS